MGPPFTRGGPFTGGGGPFALSDGVYCVAATSLFGVIDAMCGAVAGTLSGGVFGITPEKTMGRVSGQSLGGLGAGHV